MSNSFFKTSTTLPAPNPSIAVQPLCPSNLPLVLLPVRLETRFFKLPAGGTELRVRIYPDKIHLDSHEPELTPDERTWGAAYWQQDFAAGANPDARLDAWRALANRYGAPRAAWIARTLQPTNLADRGKSPTPAPRLPQLPPPPKEGDMAWRHAPQARLLPDQWVAMAHSGGKLALSAASKPVNRPLAVGPDPQAQLDATTQAQARLGTALPIDPGMKWMFDFTEAEKAGMALRMTVPPDVLAAGIDTLVVFGVSKTATPADNAAQLANLFDAHAYTDGLAFLPFGTPTNNTDDQRAGYTPEDADRTASFRNQTKPSPEQAANANKLGAALGLPTPRITPTLGRLGQSERDHDLEFRSMNAALWSVGWGYFLTNMVGPETGLSLPAVDWARDHFVSYVRAGGPLPALRVGRQPYGVLPVTSLDLWTSGAGATATPQEVWLASLLTNLRDKVWRPVVDRAARVGLRTPPDPDSDLADVMATDGVSHGNAARRVVGRQYAQHLYEIAAQSFAGLSESQDAVAQKLLDLLNLPPDPTKAAPSDPTKRPRLAKAFLEPNPAKLTAPLVQARSGPAVKLQPDYIGAILNTSGIAALETRPSTSSLLEALLRHAMLREYATAAARLANPPVSGDSVETMLRDRELNDLVDASVSTFANHVFPTPAQSYHWKRQLEAFGSTVPKQQTVRAYLESLPNFTAPAVASLGDFRTSLAKLQTLDTDTLETLLQSTLDLSAHRLDAWITSFATKRLQSMSAANAAGGAYVGGYGWVENLRPAPDQTPIPDAALPAGEAGPLYPYPKDSGFIHAPSLTHATAAALLRNAHLGPGGRPDANAPFAIDLSSSRVREADRLLDGVRKGQPLAALLGYRFERGLHDLSLNQFIAPLRTLAPLVTRDRTVAGSTAPQPPADAIAANNVVDGLALANQYQADKGGFLSNALKGATPAPTQDQLTKGNAELDALVDSIDALSDALTAEAAYQLARGNSSRLAATLSSIAQGGAAPPELEVTRMPRTSTAITHRVVVAIDDSVAVVAGWADVKTSAPATGESRLNAWLSTLLGDPRKVRCTVEQPIDGQPASVRSVSFPLSELALTPLDFVYGVDNVTGATQPTTTPTHVEQLVLYNAQRRAGGFGAQSNLRLQHARPTNLAPGEVTLIDLLDQARAIRRMLETVRGARPEDLAPPERPGQGAVNLTELQARAKAGEDALIAIQTRLQAAVAPGAAGVTSDKLRADLLLLGAYGFRPTVPSAAVGDAADTRDALIRQASAVLKDVASRLTQAANLRNQPPAADPRPRCAQLLDYGRAVFGPQVLMLPKFTCDAENAADVKAALAASTTQQGGDPLAVHMWFTRSAQVREPVSRLATCLRTSEVLAAGASLSLTVAQLPFRTGERWVGLPLLAGGVMPQSKLSIALQAKTAPDTSKPIAGLLIDEWIEKVPNASETTALTFQLDPPNAMPPQNVLVAVPPAPGQDWTTETLRRVLTETLDLAKLRGVDDRLLGATTQYLPGIYVPFNTRGDAVSTDFAPLFI